MPKTNKQRERAKRRRKGERVEVGSTNRARMQSTHWRQSREEEWRRNVEEAERRQRARKRK